MVISLRETRDINKRTYLTNYIYYLAYFKAPCKKTPVTWKNTEPHLALQVRRTGILYATGKSHCGPTPWAWDVTESLRCIRGGIPGLVLQGYVCNRDRVSTDNHIRGLTKTLPAISRMDTSSNYHHMQKTPTPRPRGPQEPYFYLYHKVFRGSINMISEEKELFVCRNINTYPKNLRPILEAVYLATNYADRLIKKLGIIHLGHNRKNLSPTQNLRRNLL